MVRSIVRIKSPPGYALAGISGSVWVSLSAGKVIVIAAVTGFVD
nr:MAG TPA: hypothetical protein [Caudoviricetes sp.]